MGEPHYVKIEKTARYFLSGPAEGDYQSVCFALHGYGQLAEYFIRPFRDKDLSTVLFVAPEGPHRFYLQGTSGRVGASWMTKEDRLKDIEDYCLYLDRLFEQLEPILQKTETVGILGFSQGVATACRWLANSRHSFDYLINYAGAFPPDLDHAKAIERTKNIPVHLLVGNKDEYISEEKYQKYLQELKSMGYDVNAKVFDGSHRVYPEVLLEAFSAILHKQ